MIHKRSDTSHATDVAKRANLVLRTNGSCFIRVRYPADIVELAGKTHFKQSLKTKDRSEAIRRLNAVSITFDDECEQLRVQRNSHPAEASVWTVDQAIDLIRRYVADHSARAAMDFASGDADALPDWRQHCLERAAKISEIYRIAKGNETQQDVQNAAWQIFMLRSDARIQTLEETCETAAAYPSRNSAQTNESRFLSWCAELFLKLKRGPRPI